MHTVKSFFWRLVVKLKAVVRLKFSSRRDLCRLLLCMQQSPGELYRDDIGLMTQEDMAFIHNTLGRDLFSVEELNMVVNNPALRSQVLDSPALLESLNRDRDALCVSEYFYFTTTVRQVMLAADVNSEEYTQNIASSLVRMSNMRRKLLQRSDSSSRYDRFDMSVLREDGKFGSNLRILCKMPPFEMVLEGIVADKDAVCGHGAQASDGGVA